MDLNVGGMFYISSGSGIDFNGAGYTATYGNETGPGGGYDGGSTGDGGGAGHGGRGGTGDGGEAKPGESNDSITNPVLPGSAGGAAASTIGSNGGGLVHIIATNIILVDGNITVNAEDGRDGFLYDSGGGGTGGTATCVQRGGVICEENYACSTGNFIHSQDSSNCCLGECILINKELCGNNLDDDGDGCIDEGCEEIKCEPETSLLSVDAGGEASIKINVVSKNTCGEYEIELGNPSGSTPSFVSVPDSVETCSSPVEQILSGEVLESYRNGGAIFKGVIEDGEIFFAESDGQEAILWEMGCQRTVFC